MYFIASGEVVTDELLVITDEGKKATLAHKDITAWTCKVYLNGTIMKGTDFSITLESGEISFKEAIVSGVVTATYEYDGVPLPYSDIYSVRNGVENVIPRNGELICFAGEFSTDELGKPTTHGTQVASLIANKGNMEDRPIEGVAPNSSIELRNPTNKQQRWVSFLYPTYTLTIQL